MIRNITILYILLAGLIITGIYADKDSFLLKTRHAPNGIISLELCFSNAKQDTLLREWKANHYFKPVYSKDNLFTTKKICGLSTAEAGTKVDFAFIGFYVALLTFLIWWGQKRYRGWLSYRHAIWLVLIAGAMDCMENIFELMSMARIAGGATSSRMALFVAIPSSIKWLLLTATIIIYYIRVLKPKQEQFLDRFNKLVKEFVVELWHYRIVVIGLLVIFLMLNYVEQGEDLLITINSSGCGILWFLAVFLVLAMLNWYLPKVYTNAKKIRNPRGLREALSAEMTRDDPNNIKKYLARIIGSATLLVPATGILTAMSTYHIGYWFDILPPTLIFPVTIYLYIIILRYKPFDRYLIIRDGDGEQIGFRVKIFWSIFIFFFGLIILFAVLAADGEPTSLAFLSLAFFIGSFLFLLSVIYRECFDKGLPFRRLLLSGSTIVFLLFFLFNFRWFSALMTSENRFFSLPIFISGIVFYTLFFSALLLMGTKWKIQLISIVLLTTVVISSNSITTFHQVSLHDRPANDTIKEDSLRIYVHRWLESRRSEITAQSAVGKQYPVFFVNAYGGGIKAAAWTTVVVGRMNRLVRADTALAIKGLDFEHYVFSFSGASGGTIGLSLLAGARITNAAQPINDTIFSSNKARQVYEHDYLTNDIVGILGRDALMGSIGRSWYADRARVTEEAWEDYTEPLGISYKTAFRLGWHAKGMEVPLFVSNTYDIDGGTKAILAPVKLRQSDFPGALLLQKLIDSSKDIRLSSGAFLSARFPYVSPTGKFNEQHHFTDGGTIENSGAETSLQLINVFNSIVDSLKNKTETPDTVFKNIKICILSIPNSIPALDSVERVRNVYETGAPIAGILQSVGGNAIKAEAINFYTANAKGWKYYRMVPNDAKIIGGTIHPILPLGWQISKYALDMMDSTVVRKRTAIDTMMMLFEANFRKSFITKLKGK